MVREIIEMMRTVPPGQSHLDDAALRLLRALTRSLTAARTGAAQEHARYLGIGQRQLTVPEADLREQLRGRAILVTGGTGCIGSALMRQLAQRGPGRLVSVSRGVAPARPLLSGAEYLRADIRDRRALDTVVREVRPDMVFHLAAQRDPGLAELEVHRTVTTNVLGTRNVLAAAAAAGASRVVCASTGKALRPYSPDIYTASKRAAEWVASCAATTGEMPVTAARFTHVVDNSIIYRRLLDWADGGVIRLHGSDIAFYAQSGCESAQLLLIAGLSSGRHEYRVHAITDLGMPVALLDLAVGVLMRTGSAAPIYFSRGRFVPARDGGRSGAPRRAGRAGRSAPQRPASGASPDAGRHLPARGHRPVARRGHGVARGSGGSQHHIPSHKWTRRHGVPVPASPIHHCVRGPGRERCHPGNGPWY